MKIETRYQPDKSAELKGEGIIESSRGNTTENNQIPTLKIIIVEHVLEDSAVLSEEDLCETYYV